jgi:hypothetical protein
LLERLTEARPEPQLVSVGTTIAVDVLVSADGKRKVVDYIQFPILPTTLPTVGPSLPTAANAPKDLTLDDGPLQFDFAGFVSIDGRTFQGPTWFSPGKNGGATLWFSLPGKGRFILSLAPHDEFAKLGAIWDNVISFESDGQKYEIRMKSPIVGSGGAWNIYVLHDTSYKPDNSILSMISRDLAAGTPIVIGGTDRLENLLPEK